MKKNYDGIKIKLFLIISISILIISTREIADALERDIAIMSQENRVALVIGNGNYKVSPLANTVYDATDIAIELKSCGFDVIKEIDCSRKAMRRSIRQFEEKIRKGGVGLFYYAGHGIQINGENFLVPVDSDITREYEVEDECVKVSNVLRAMMYADNRLNIVILDACRNNPFQRSFRSPNSGLAKMDAPTGSFVAYATAPGSVALDGTGKNGLYTSILLKYTKVAGLKIEDVFKKVRMDVIQYTGGNQVPWESSSLTGDFYFRLPGNIVNDKKPVTTQLKEDSPERYYVSVDSELKSVRFISLKNRFTKKSDGSIYDSYLKKSWLAMGQNEVFSWEDANDYCQSFLRGYKLPTKEELQSLIIRDKSESDGRKIDSKFFPKNYRSTKYWTSSSVRFKGKWYVDFETGTWGTMSKTNCCAVLAISIDKKK